MNTVMKTNCEGLNKIYEGKVREIYAVSDMLLLVATDRISAFDVVFNEGIADKGRILTQVSNHWFNLLDFKNHLVETDSSKFPEECLPYAEILKDRAVLVKRANRVDFECIVRGYIIGSGWKDYQKTGAICGIKLPSNLKLADKLPEAIFTPSTKAPDGEHDVNVDFSEMENTLGKEMANNLKDISINIYTDIQKRAAEKGIILADTKFEFGLDDDGEIMLIDECCTPDSSRFWEAETYTPGKNPDSFDKQIFRDYLETLNWDKTPPPPAIPEDIAVKTRNRYIDIYKRITGKDDL